MRLNENDARAVDTVLNGLSGESARNADGRSSPGESSGAGHVGYYPTPGSVSAMNNDLAARVTKLDNMLKLLDYLPADEPPGDLVQQTLRRVEEARRQSRQPTAHAGAMGASVSGSTGLSQGLHRSPAPRGDDEPAA